MCLRKEKANDDHQANYILCMGPLMFAIIVWKNSLVFHSLDKLTSFFLHAFPPITIHLFRSGTDSQGWEGMTSL